MSQRPRPALSGVLRRVLLRRVLVLGAALALLLTFARSSSAASGAAEAPDGGRVVVLGFDGADWRTTERLMGEGALPNLAKLRAEGSAGPLVSTNPAESAAGWAGINTGANPVKNGVPSFVKRAVAGESVMPDLGHVRPRTLEVSGEQQESASGALDRILNETNPAVLAGVTALVAFLLFRFLLGAGAVLALLIAALLGVGAYFASGSAESGVPTRIPTFLDTQVKLDGFWVEAARSGHPSIALQAPMAFGRPGADGARTLYGLGIPDVRGSINGDWAIYTAAPLATGRAPKGKPINSGTTGTQFRVDFEAPEGGGPERMESQLYGPINFLAADALTRRLDEIEAIYADEEAFKALGFKESSELGKEKSSIAKELAEMGLPLPGDRTPSKLYRHRMEVPLVVERDGDGFRVEIDGESQTLAPGAWSDFYSVRFDLSSTFHLSAITRAKVLKAEPLELYVDTLQYDPRDQAFWQPTSDPPAFGAAMADALGAPYETLGWGCMTNQVKDQGMAPEPFLEDVEFTMKWRRKLLDEALADGDWEVLYAVFSTTDRVQHMMYRYYDPEHPLYDADLAATEIDFFGESLTFADTIPAIYRQMDDVVGGVMAALGPNDTLLLCADHGFTSFRRQVNVNNWLAEEGFLVLRDDVTGKSGGLDSIDWSRTKAYSLGLGMVFLNLEGREPNGIVSLADADAVMDDLCARFVAARDEGRTIGTSAIKVKDVYDGPEEWGTEAYPCSDVMLGFAEFYRTSWDTVFGNMPLNDGAPGRIYEDNDNLWSGDHASNDPELVSGIFFSNKKVEAPEGGYSVFHIAPTVLDRVGAPIPDHYDRAPLAPAQ